MKKAGLSTSFLCALVMGVLTVLFCPALADGVLHMYSYHTIHYWRNVLPGRIVCGVFLLGLPLSFLRVVKWRHTLLNLPLYFLLYFLLYFPVDMIFGSSPGHLFLASGGFIAFPPSFHAAIVAVVFWGLQSLVYLACDILGAVVRGRRSGPPDGPPAEQK